MPKRNAVRAVIFDKDKRIAVLSVRDGMYHKIAGGGIDEGESEEQALHREAAEEAACRIEIIEKLGESKFTDPGEVSLEHFSTCYLARKTEDIAGAGFTEDEKKDGFALMWLGIEEAIEKFRAPLTKNAFELAMNNRDWKFIEMARTKIG